MPGTSKYCLSNHYPAILKSIIVFTIVVISRNCELNRCSVYNKLRYNLRKCFKDVFCYVLCWSLWLTCVFSEMCGTLCSAHFFLCGSIYRFYFGLKLFYALFCCSWVSKHFDTRLLLQMYFCGLIYFENYLVLLSSITSLSYSSSHVLHWEITMFVETVSNCSSYTDLVFG